MSITCLKGAVYRIWSRSVHFEKIGKKSAKNRQKFGRLSAAITQLVGQVARSPKKTKDAENYQLSNGVCRDILQSKLRALELI